MDCSLKFISCQGVARYTLPIKQNIANNDVLCTVKPIHILSHHHFKFCTKETRKRVFYDIEMKNYILWYSMPSHEETQTEPPKRKFFTMDRTGQKPQTRLLMYLYWSSFKLRKEVISISVQAFERLSERPFLGSWLKCHSLSLHALRYNTSRTAHHQIQDWEILGCCKQLTGSCCLWGDCKVNWKCKGFDRAEVRAFQGHMA